MRLIDKSKKANIKCEHCGYWAGRESSKCLLTGKEKMYYNRCKEFTWDESKQYSQVSQGGFSNG